MDIRTIVIIVLALASSAFLIWAIFIQIKYDNCQIDEPVGRNFLYLLRTNTDPVEVLQTGDNTFTIKVTPSDVNVFIYTDLPFHDAQEFPGGEIAYEMWRLLGNANKANPIKPNPNIEMTPEQLAAIQEITDKFNAQDHSHFSQGPNTTITLSDDTGALTTSIMSIFGAAPDGTMTFEHQPTQQIEFDIPNGTYRALSMSEDFITFFIAFLVALLELAVDLGVGAIVACAEGEIC